MIDASSDDLRAGLLDDGPLLWMNGTDHLMPQPWLGRVVAEANAHRRTTTSCAVGSLAEYLAARARPTGLPAWRGELRSGRPGQPAHGRGLQPGRRAPGRAPWPSARSSGWPSRWRAVPARPTAGRPRCSTRRGCEVIRNAAHDSVCACSVDEVCDAVLHRYAEARQIAEGLTDRARRPPWAGRSGGDPARSR